MKILKRFLLLLTASLALSAFAPRAQADGYDYFYDTLQPYGDWVQVSGYGYVWHPSNVDDDWAPYTDGYWAYTDDGWTWVSYEDFGGITYHYGRWTRLEDEGWVWVPGSEWAPAWVSWRSSDDYVGWAPLPPEAHWRVGVGFGRGVDAQFDIGPGCYSFVDVHHFGEPELRQVIVRREQNVTIINRTTNITNITVNNSNVYVGGPRYATMAARSSRPIQTLKLVRQTDSAAARAAGGKTLAHTQGNQLVVLSPKITAPAEGAHLQPSKVAKTLTNSKVEHGWSVVKDPAEREKLRTAVKAQSHGAGPAKAVTAEEAQLPTGTAAVKGEGAVSPAEATVAATPRMKGKKGKAALSEGGSTPSTAVESTGGVSPADAVAAATPRVKGGKGKKPKTSFDQGTVRPEAATPTEEVMATPKPAKAKKVKTPPVSNGGEAFDSGATPKRSGDTGANLQPFMGGADHPAATEGKKARKAPVDRFDSGASDAPVPKERKLPADRPIEPRGGSAGIEERGVPAAVKPHAAKVEKGGKGDKGDKKPKDDSIPPQ